MVKTRLNKRRGDTDNRDDSSGDTLSDTEPLSPKKSTFNFSKTSLNVINQRAKS
jgi:hypothetical protein